MSSEEGAAIGHGLVGDEAGRKQIAALVEHGTRLATILLAYGDYLVDIEGSFGHSYGEYLGYDMACIWVGSG